MFGTYRFLLAMIVVYGHIVGGTMGWVGGYAVFGFYTLSGYLMTRIMNESYGYTLGGIKRYALNRFLRIYPAYWMACALSLLLLVIFSSAAVARFHPAIQYPTGIYNIFSNLFIFGLDPHTEQKLVPPAWALAVELTFYTLIGLFLGRTKAIAAIWFILSAIYAGWLVSSNAGWEARYYPRLAASLVFSMGACIYHFREPLGRLLKPDLWKISIATLLCAANYLIVPPSMSFGYAFYFNALISGVLVHLLSQYTSSLALPAKLDKWFGDLSYPVYLIHWQIALLVVMVLSLKSTRGLKLFLAVIPIMIPLAWMIHLGVEKRIEKIRTSIKAKNRKTEPVYREKETSQVV